MTAVYAVLSAAGFALAIWARLSLPEQVPMWPVRVQERSTKGPYRWFRHPMYAGNILFIAGLGGVAAGFWNALALFTLAELLMREWAWREDQ